MAKAYDFFSGSQEDINRRLLRKILALETVIGDEDTPTSILGRIKALEQSSQTQGGGAQEETNP